jgi:hypothetical protein
MPLGDSRPTVGYQRPTATHFPHRRADAYIHDSIVEGVRFD